LKPNEGTSTGEANFANGNIESYSPADGALIAKAKLQKKIMKAMQKAQALRMAYESSS
jgi:hypothetical protein